VMGDVFVCGGGGSSLDPTQCKFYTDCPTSKEQTRQEISS